jgi:hypothetical protein
MMSHPVISDASLLPRMFLLSLAITAIDVSGGPAEAGGPQVPWECSSYSDEAQTRCLNAFIERQQEQIGQLERRLQAQQEQVGQLKGEVDRQAAATNPLQQQLAQPPVTAAIAPPPYYPYAFAYPPVGIGLYLGRPWIGPGFYGYYGRPYWGTRFFYRHHGRHW